MKTFTIQFEGTKFYRTSENRTYTHAVVVVHTDESHAAEVEAATRIYGADSEAVKGVRARGVQSPGVIGWNGSLALAERLVNSKRSKPYWKGAKFVIVEAVATEGRAPRGAKSTGGNAVRSVTVSCPDCGEANETRGHMSCQFPSSTEGA